VENFYLVDSLHVCPFADPIGDGLGWNTLLVVLLFPIPLLDGFSLRFVAALFSTMISY
jgi:hypothetical protein